MSESTAQDVLPTVFTGMPGTSFAQQELALRPVTRDGRNGAEMHPLYGTGETGENGPAAAVVRYLPGAVSSPHLHPGYEIIYVISGELETDDGVYGPNSVLVMPPGSVHTPRSPRGCVGLAVWEQPVRPA